MLFLVEMYMRFILPSGSLSCGKFNDFPRIRLTPQITQYRDNQPSVKPNMQMLSL